MPASADKYQNWHEHELQQAYHLHDVFAFVELWLRHEQLFQGVARKNNPRLAEDCVSQLKTQLADAKTQDSYNPGFPWRNWSLGILRNILISQWRAWDKRRVTSQTFLDSLPAASTSAAEVAQRKELEDVLRNCVNQLPADLHQVLTLYFLQELRVEEVAKQCGVSNGTVSKRKARALRALQECLEGVFGLEAES